MNKIKFSERVKNRNKPDSIVIPEIHISGGIMLKLKKLEGSNSYICFIYIRDISKRYAFDFVSRQKEMEVTRFKSRF